MAINTAAFMQDNFTLTRALGEKLNAGDATFSPDGFEGLYLLIKQFPHPIVSVRGEIMVPFAGGGDYPEAQPVKTDFQGPVTFLETVAGSAKQFFRDVLAAGGYFDGRIYEGTPDRHTRSYKIVRNFIVMDPSDRDWENKGQILQLTGTMFGNYFGVEAPGNI